MICARCKLDKPCLFTPGAIAAKAYARYCRKCQAEKAGKKFGTSNQHAGMKKADYRCVMDEKRVDTIKSARDAFKKEETKRLIAQREARLQGHK